MVENTELRRENNRLSLSADQQDDFFKNQLESFDP